MLLRGATAEIIRGDFGLIVMAALEVIDAHFQGTEVSIGHGEELLRLLIDRPVATDLYGTELYSFHWDLH